MNIKMLLLLVIILVFPVGKKGISQDTNASKHEFRGVWIATVRNLDWPSEPGIPVAQMKAEYIEQLDLLRKLGMNAVIVQVRPSGDALYPSALEPWSQYLTGKQGVPPPGGFDPLNFMIEEAHVRSMEFHAWFNPFRGIRDIDETEIAADHVIHKHPEWFVRYGQHLYFDPGYPEARKFSLDVIMDVVHRYDVDAVHFDDYFYPYRLAGEAFPDSVSFEKFGGPFYPGRKDDWRRENINQFIEAVHDSIAVTKPWVHFGISPFGVWRNKSRDPRGSETETLQTNYDDLYGDALKWVHEGWLDYILPQCYQYLGREIMDYRVVTQWWNENHGKANFFIGQSPYRLGQADRGGPWMVPNEIERQLIYHDSVPDLRGSAFFRSRTFLTNPMGLNDILRSKFFKYPALPPPSPEDTVRTNQSNPGKVTVSVSDDSVHLSCEPDQPEKIRWYILYASAATEDPAQIIRISPRPHFSFLQKELEEKLHTFYLTTVDKYRIESEAQEIRLQIGN